VIHADSTEMTEPARSPGLWDARAPTATDIDEIAQAAYAGLPTAFRKLCEELVIQVVDFPDEETLKQMNSVSEFDLIGLFCGRGLPHRSAFDETGALPNMI
jgi:predicted Zn-dependent protease with MMP-like domain